MLIFTHVVCCIHYNFLLFRITMLLYISVRKTSDSFPATFPRPVKICWTSTTLTIKYISHFLSYRVDACTPKASGERKLKSIDIFYYYCSASTGYFSMLRKITGKQSRIL